MGNLAELPDHGRGHVVHRHQAGKLVGVGKKIAFERWRPGSDVGNESLIVSRDCQELVGRAKARSFDCSRDVEHREAFRDNDRAEVNIATAKALLDLDEVCGLIEKIFACLERSSVMVVVPKEESFLTADDPGGFELSGNASG